MRYWYHTLTTYVWFATWLNHLRLERPKHHRIIVRHCPGVHAHGTPSWWEIQ